MDLPAPLHPITTTNSPHFISNDSSFKTYLLFITYIIALSILAVIRFRSDVWIPCTSLCKARPINVLYTIEPIKLIIWASTLRPCNILSPIYTDAKPTITGLTPLPISTKPWLWLNNAPPKSNKAIITQCQYYKMVIILILTPLFWASHYDTLSIICINRYWIIRTQYSIKQLLKFDKRLFYLE